MTDRYGITIPFNGISLAEHREVLATIRSLGYTDVWTSEVDGADGFTPLALAAAWEPSLNLGIAIAPAYTRGPALLAQTVASLADSAPGRFFFGLGSSSEVIVHSWNGLAFDEPYKRVRDTLRFLRVALSGEKVTRDFETFSIDGFRLSRIPAIVPPLFLAALRPGMLRLAGKEADGVILNWLSSGDVSKAVAEVGPGKEIAARLFVCPTEDKEKAHVIGRRMIAAYMNVAAYADFHRWLGRGDAFAGMWDAWAKGDRKAALAAIPDEVVDALFINGSGAHCKKEIQKYVDAGVTIPMLLVVPTTDSVMDAVLSLAPGESR
jgi:probable F420-dependent oxidoreductase